MSDGVEHAGPSRRPGTIAVGLTIIVVGALLLLDRIGTIEFNVTSHLWPFIVIALGAAKLADTTPCANGRQRSRVGGVWLIAVGCWGLINEYELFGLDYRTSWPLLIVVAGLLIVWRAVWAAPGAPPRADGTEPLASGKR